MEAFVSVGLGSGAKRNSRLHHRFQRFLRCRVELTASPAREKYIYATRRTTADFPSFFFIRFEFNAKGNLVSLPLLVPKEVNFDASVSPARSGTCSPVCVWGASTLIGRPLRRRFSVDDSGVKRNLQSLQRAI